MNHKTNRREFLAECGMGACALGTLALLPCAAALAEDVSSAPASGELSLNPVEARHYKRLADKKVECGICPHKCQVADLERGTCGVRENRDGTYYTLVHSRAAAVHTDPIVQARCEEVEARGGNSFTHYTLPGAVIRFKQGVGRLIRMKTDFGVVCVLDRRVLTRRYGDQFLRSLPTGYRTCTSPRHMCDMIRAFLTAHPLAKK